MYGKGERNVNDRANYNNQKEKKNNYFTIKEDNTIITMNGSNKHDVVASGGGYSDVSSTSSPDLEDGGGGGGIETENPGLMRRRRSTTSRRENNASYESIPTNSNNNVHYPPASRLSSCFGCASVLCQTVVIVTAMMLIGTTGFLIGSAKPDLLIATVNATTGIDLADYLAEYGSSGSIDTVDIDTVDIEAAITTTAAPSPPSISCDEILQDKNETETMMNNDNDTAVDDIVEKKKKTKVTIRYDPSIVLANSITNNDDDELNNPFNNPPGNNNLFLTPPHPFSTTTTSTTTTSSSPVGYIRRPHLVDNRLVFLAEGDAYVSRLNLDGDSSTSTLSTTTSMPASKVTTTIGNVLDPKLHPTLPLLAYTATYSGRRDVYLMDLSASKKSSSSSSPIRLTYWDVGTAGVNGIIGWISTNGSKHANAIVFRAISNDSSLPDYRLYIIHLETTTKTDGINSGDRDRDRLLKKDSSTTETIKNNNNNNIDNYNYNYNSVLEIEPIPLAQAMDAARFQKCWYFVRVKQSSHTIRYVGGTAENLWLYCDDNENSTTSSSSSSSSQPLFSDDGYKGTSNSPQLHHHDGGDGSNNKSHYLFFLSDRGRNTKEQHPKWIPDRMNVWAIRLNDDKDNQDSSSSSSISMSYSTNDLIQITDTSCDFEGRTIQEYSIDSAAGNLVVRIGADLYFMSNDDIRSKIDNHNSNNSDAENNNDNNNKKNDNKDNRSIRRNNRRSLEQQQEEEEAEKQEITNIDDSIRDDENDNGNDSNHDDQEEKEPDVAEEDDDDTNKSSLSSTSTNSRTQDVPPATSSTTKNSNTAVDDESMNNNNKNSLADETPSSEIDANNETITITTSTDNVATEEVSTDTTTTTTTTEEENTANEGEQKKEIVTIIPDNNKLPQNVIPDVIPEVVPEVVPEVIPEVIPDTSEDIVAPNSTNNVTYGDDPNKDPSTTAKKTTATTVSNLSLEKDDSTESNITSSDNSTDPPAKYYYDFQSPELVSRSTGNVVSDNNSNQVDDYYSGHSTKLKRLPIEIYSDFQSEQERIIPVDILEHFKYGDVFETITGSTQMLLTLRGQVWVASTAHDALPSYEDTGKNLPARRYRVAPGSTMGGVTRVLAAMHVPNPVEDDISDRRLAVILATDPLTVTAEHAFYLIETQPGASPLFVDMDRLPKPFLGGIVSGGSTKDGGLGSIKADTLAMSPCGNRMAWSDTDGRIVVMNLPQYQELDNGDGGDDESSTLKQSTAKFVVLPQKNELDESMVGDEVELVFSPGGRYLSIQHNAQNQFSVISIADLGDPLGEENRIADIVIGRIVQATPSRFNSVKAYWGKTPTDIHNIAQNKTMSKLFSVDEPDDVPATTIYFLSDRDIKTDVTSPWGTRQQMPHFVTTYGVYAIPFQAKDIEPKDSQGGQFRGGGVEELHVDTLLERMALIQSLLDEKETPTSRREKRKLAETLHPLAGAFGFAEKAFKNQKRRRRQLDGDNIGEEDADGKMDTVDHLEEAVFPKDIDIDFGAVDLNFARRAYRLSTIPEGAYNDILCQNPDGSLILVKDKKTLEFFVADGYPSDQYEDMTFNAKTRTISSWGLSASRKFFYLIYSPDGAIRVVPNTNQGRADLLADDELDRMVVDKKGMHLSIWPSLEYRQMYDDAWRMLRDYFYDQDMTGIDWPEIHERFLPLVERCTKREELDDVLAQMASELSALHVFVYNGEYSFPLHNDDDLKYVNEVGSLGAILKRTPAWKGYTVMNIPEADPDFTKIDHSSMIYSPLSDQSLRLSGQRGLQVGDVIVGINGESVMAVPDIHMLLRGTAGRSIRLEVLRLASGTATTDDTGGIKTSETNDEEATVESLITVPISPSANSDLLYSAWEWKTQQMADEMAAKAGISVGYVHMRSMSGAEAEDEFARGFFPNYKKQGFILDVRHNRGGSIDSWVLDVLQRKSWMYWQSRDYDATDGGLDWDMHFAFRGHVIVLMDEKTSSDGEGVSRGIKELGLGKLIGTRTWGGGIWLASDNHLVDGGIATAPEIGTYNENIGWGLGIEQMGVDPDIVVDNDPHETYTGKDQQLERAIEELKKWIEEEPVVIPKPKAKKKDMTMGDRECKASSPQPTK